MPRPRFSLRTLLLLALLAGSALTLHFHWEPWARVATVTNVTGFTEATPRCLIQIINDEELRLIDVATQQLHASVKLSEFDSTQILLASRHHVLAGDKSGNFKIIDLQTRQKQELKLYADHNAELAFAPNGKWLLINEPPTLYDLEKRQAIFRDDRPIAAVRIHEPDEVEAAERLRQASIKTAHQCQNLQQLQQQLAPVLRAHFWFSDDGGILLSSVDFETVQVWDTNTGQRLSSVMIGRQYGGFSCHVSPNGRRLAVASGGQTTVYAVETSTALATIPRELIPNKRDRCDDSGQRWQFVRPQSSEAYLKGINECRVEIYDVRLGLLHTLVPNEVFISENGLCLSADGARLFLNEKCAVISAETGAVLYQFPLVNSDNPFAPVVAGFVDGRMLVRGDRGEWHIFERRRDERLIGVLQLPEFWLTLLFTVALLASLRADYRSLRGNPPAPVPATGQEAA